MELLQVPADPEGKQGGGKLPEQAGEGCKAQYTEP